METEHDTESANVDKSYRGKLVPYLIPLNPIPASLSSSENMTISFFRLIAYGPTLPPLRLVANDCSTPVRHCGQ